jgi:hypothetical protein
MLITFPFYLKNRIKVDSDAKRNPQLAEARKNMLICARRGLIEVLAMFELGNASTMFVDYDSRFKDRELKTFERIKGRLKNEQLAQLQLVESELKNIGY